jgi:hypothetical protein
MELPDFIPSQSRVERQRDQVEKLYDQMNMEQQFRDDVLEAEDFVFDKGADPQSRVGMHLVNRILRDKLQQMAAEVGRQAQQIAEDMDDE